MSELGSLKFGSLQNFSFNHIEQRLKNTLESGNMLSAEEVTEDIMRLNKRKAKLVQDIYESTHPRAKLVEGLSIRGFYKTSRGYIRSRDPDYYANSEDELIQILYDHYFGCGTLEAECNAWLLKRINSGTKTNKTIREDMGIWKRVFQEDPISQQAVEKITPKNIRELYERWFFKKRLTLKAFRNQVSLLNGIFGQAVLDGLIPVNFISSVPYKDLNFQDANDPEPYTSEEREILLNHIKSLPKQDAYSLAIQFAFHTTMRIGEIKALKPEDIEDDFIHVNEQLVEDNRVIVKEGNVSVGVPINIIKKPKGREKFSIRDIEITSEGKRILQEALSLNPDGNFIFMHKGRNLTTDSFNARLRKYINDINSKHDAEIIRYRSSHKIRFCVASMLYHEGNLTLEELRIFLGHSSVKMTEHYAKQPVAPKQKSGVLETVLG